MAITLDGTNGITSPDFEPSSSTTPTNGLFLPAANTVGLATGSTERLRIDSSGNLGLGVTPSAWSLGKALDLGGGASILGYANYTYLSSNAYYNSGWKYIGSGNATYYQQNSGIHAWNTAPSGTAGNAISFTQAMTLDASGNLGVGTSSPYSTSGSTVVTIGGSSTSTTGKLFLRSAADSNQVQIYVGSTYNEFDSQQELNIRTESGALRFTTVNTERARIDSSGNLLVGTTTISDANQAALCVYATFPKTVVELRQSGTSQHYAITFRNGNGLVGNINTSGTTTSYVTSSDQRLKENIVDAPSALTSVNAIKVRSFDWKVDGSHVDYGYIAQELLAVVPEAVSVPADPNQMMGVDFGKLTPRLVKAIQELTARLEALEAK